MFSLFPLMSFIFFFLNIICPIERGEFQAHYHGQLFRFSSLLGSVVMPFLWAFLLRGLGMKDALLPIFSTSFSKLFFARPQPVSLFQPGFIW